MRILKVAILILGIAFVLSLIAQIMGMMVTGQQFIYNLSQMEYNDAYTRVEKLVKSYISELPPGYAISEDMIRTELNKYLAQAAELSAWENVIHRLRPAIEQLRRWSGGILATFLAWHILLDTRGQEKIAKPLDLVCYNKKKLR